MTGDPAARRAADARGRHAEERAAAVLERRGCRVMARRFRARGGEVDLIVRAPGDILAFVEVKARTVGDDALAAVGPRQRRRIETAALAFLATRPDVAGLALRFDVVALDRHGTVQHLPDAWRPDSAPGAF